jgi:hypothetical protein
MKFWYTSASFDCSCKKMFTHPMQADLTVFKNTPSPASYETNV